MTQSPGKTYAQLIKFGRQLKDHVTITQVCDAEPEKILALVDHIDRQLLWTSTEDFFSLFPPIKRFAEEGVWDYKSTQEMRSEELGERFGKDDFKKLLMTRCYENKYLQLVGFAFMCAASRAYYAQTQRTILDDFVNSK